MATLSPLLLAALLWVPVRTLTCYGDSGQPVDWFVVYKLPAQSGPGDAAQRGLRYKYMDKDSGAGGTARGPSTARRGRSAAACCHCTRTPASSPSCYTMTSHLNPVGPRTSSPSGGTQRACCSWTKKGASGWSTAFHSSLHPPPLGHTAGLLTPTPMGKPCSVYLSSCSVLEDWPAADLHLPPSV